MKLRISDIGEYWLIETTLDSRKLGGLTVKSVLQKKI